jgi:hypothetical protein
MFVKFESARLRFVACVWFAFLKLVFTASFLILNLGFFSISQAAENVVINAYGSQAYGIGPHVQLWINGVNVGELDVNATTASNYTFSVNLPSNGNITLDVVFTNDDCCIDGDRNLIVNSVLIRGLTLLPTDAGVIIDRGAGAAAFDGVDTIAGQTGIYWSGALRFAFELPRAALAYYNLDEPVWNGSLNETKDSAGYTGGPFNGEVVGTPVPVATNTSPARPGATGTCGYADFTSSAGGGAFRLEPIPVTTTSNNFTSVSYWMYWNGNTQLKIAIGWNIYNLELTSNFIGFNTGNSDLYGTNISSLANGWHHFTAIFKNSDAERSKLYIDGTLRSLSRLASNGPNNGYAQVTSTLNVGGWGYNTSNRFFGGRFDEVKVYNGEITQTQVTADYNAVHACAGYNVAPANFNCVATAAASNTGHLYTQLVGAAFNVDVVALKSDGTVETSYVTSGTKNVTVELVTGSGSTACASRTSLSPTVSQTVSFSPTDSGRKNIGVTVNKAYRDLRCRVVDTNQAPTIVGCSSDNFSVKPTEFTLSSNANADLSGVGQNLTPVFKTGQNFTLTVNSAVGYDGSPLLDASKLFVHTITPNIGTVSGAFPAATAATGVSSGSFQYSEVGYFKYQLAGVYDDTFTAVDSANGDCVLGNVAVNGINSCKIINTVGTDYVGRFIPDHFAVIPGTATPQCGSSFTYFGQDGIATGFTLQAQNSSNVITQNYTDRFAKLDLSNWTNFNFSASPLPSGSTLTASSTPPTGGWLNGVATVAAKHLVARPTSVAAPTNIVFSMAPTDNDGVTMNIAPVAPASPFKYGRLWLANGYGSELLPLAFSLTAQYWNGTTYQTNQQDSCTVVPASSIAMGNYKKSLNACETQISTGGSMSAGRLSTGLSAPGNGNQGSVDLSVNLNSASGTTCNSASASSASSANLPWFGSANPSARATFGIYKSPLIYMRENF